jgi:hypothetical protein
MPARSKRRAIPNPHPGEILMDEFLKPMALSQTALANAIAVPPRRINEIVLGKRAAPPRDRRGAQGDPAASGVIRCPKVQAR